MGGFRGLPSPQVRGFGAQDVRLEDRQSYESRTPSVPLPHRSIGDDSITLGPQGGLARGMSIRGPPAMSSGPLGDISPGSGDSRRLTAGLNGYSSVPDRTTYSSREEIMPRYIPERFGGPSAYDQSSTQDRNLQYVNRDVRTPDRGFDRSLATSPPARAHGPAVSQNVPPEKVWPEERLRDMSIAAIKEFYSCMLMSTQWKAEKIGKDVSVGGSLERKVHLINWEVVCAQKEKGGLGLRKIILLNEALLGKWIWRFAIEKDNLWKVLLVKYGQEGLGWRTNEFKVGKGTKIKFWTDHWCGNAALSQIFPQLFALAVHRNATVNEVIFRGGFCFLERRGSGIFGVKDAYILLVAPNDFSFPKKSIWVDKVPTKAAFFAWEATWAKILTLDSLKNGDCSSPIAVFCVVVKKKL
ncbi:Eukaryotic translation initiation factor 4G [Vitis vinifera]|uniref:Eukaryotic translation initiation factor 4G n=1 Tax=Vitis vinifera TaxID=29760 RepID=A0A438IES3_VITVI|nr:Eukaryotic translation initiation factor 4G [Vitis vinifera]